MKNYHRLATALLTAALVLSATACASDYTSVNTPTSTTESTSVPSTSTVTTTITTIATEMTTAVPEDSSPPSTTTTVPTTATTETPAAPIYTTIATEEPDIPAETSITTTVTAPSVEIPEELPDAPNVSLISLLQDGDWMCNVTISVHSTDGNGAENTIIPKSAEDINYILDQLFSISVTEMEYTEPSVLAYSLILDDGNGVYNTIGLPLNESWISYGGKTYTIPDGALDIEHLQKLIDTNGAEVIAAPVAKPVIMFDLMQEPFNMSQLKILSSSNKEIIVESYADCSLLNAQFHTMYVTKSDHAELPSIYHTFIFSSKDGCITNVIDFCESENMLRYNNTVYNIHSGALNLDFLERLIKNDGSAILPDDAPIAIGSDPIPECEVPIYRPINDISDFIVVYATPQKIYYDMIEDVDAEVGKPMKLMLPYKFYNTLKECDQVIFNIRDGYERELGQEFYFLEDTQHDYLYRRVLSPDDILRIIDGVLTPHDDDNGFVYKDTIETDLITFYDDFHYGMTTEELDAFIANQHEGSISLAQFMAENPDTAFELMPGAFNFYNGICIRATISFEQ